MEKESPYGNKNDRLVRVILELGSNSDAQRGMALAEQFLRGSFGNRIFFSRKLWTNPIGMETDTRPYLNQLAEVQTLLPLDGLLAVLKNIERRCGRISEGKVRGQIAMDIDVLMYGARRLHGSDWKRPYVRMLMKELKDCFNRKEH